MGMGRKRRSNIINFGEVRCLSFLLLVSELRCVSECGIRSLTSIFWVKRANDLGWRRIAIRRLSFCSIVVLALL